jgi:hypothetical protein
MFQCPPEFWQDAEHEISLNTGFRLYMSLIVPVLLYACETWTITKDGLDRLQAFHMRCQRQILNIRWFDKDKNTDIFHHSKLPHIGDLIQQRRHAHFGHVVHMNQLSPAHLSLKLSRNISMNRRVPLGWKRPRSRPCSTWISQLKKDTSVPAATA